MEIQRASKEQLDQLLDSLRYELRTEREDQVARRHYSGTFEWMFSDHISDDDSDHISDDDSSDQYGSESSREWLKEHCLPDLYSWLESPEPNLFWITGKPGSGKSTFVYFITNHHSSRELFAPDERDTTVVTHYLWSAGSAPIQRNLKGTLCSLVYQLISAQHQIYDAILLKFPHTSTYRFVSDWPIRVLKQVVFAICGEAPNQICVFLDGLDEIVNDEVDELLDLVDELLALRTVKLCVSSRPELVFANRLAAHASLRVQDVKRPDIERYCKDKLGDLTESEDDLSHIIHSIRVKDDGVFLWVALATQSLLRGSRNLDEPETLLQRIQQLPAGMYDLYKEMWKRQNDDEALYQQDASRYFNLILAWNEMNELQAKDAVSQHNLSSVMMEILDKPSSVEDFFINISHAMSPDELHLRLARASRFATKLATRSGGLIEVSTRGNVQLIHRSAAEFLTSTAEGLSVFTRNQDSKSNLYARLAAALVISQLSTGHLSTFANEHEYRWWHPLNVLVYWHRRLCLEQDSPSAELLRYSEIYSRFALDALWSYHKCQTRTVCAWMIAILRSRFYSYLPAAMEILKKDYPHFTPLLQDSWTQLLRSALESFYHPRNILSLDCQRAVDLVDWMISEGLDLSGVRSRQECPSNSRHLHTPSAQLVEWCWKRYPRADPKVLSLLKKMLMHEHDSQTKMLRQLEEFPKNWLPGRNFMEPVVNIDRKGVSGYEHVGVIFEVNLTFALNVILGPLLASRPWNELTTEVSEAFGRRKVQFPMTRKVLFCWQVSRVNGLGLRLFDVRRLTAVGSERFIELIDKITPYMDDLTDGKPTFSLNNALEEVFVDVSGCYSTVVQTRTELPGGVSFSLNLE